MPDAQSMIERIARAAMLHMTDELNQPFMADDATPPAAYDIARAILTAMREPDPSFWSKVTNQGDTAEHNARALWQHMIDAALEDGR